MAREKINDKVVIEDHAAAYARRANAELEKEAGLRRKAHIDALRTELAYLERQPKPNESRIAEVNREINRYRKAPTRPELETAQAPAPAPAKKAAAPRRPRTPKA
jgi:hypothetical protein